MADLILVKHAAPEIDELVPPSLWELSETGRRQSLELAKRLASYDPQAVVSSWEPKAIQTAEICGAYLGLAPTTSSGIQENDRAGLPFFDNPDAYRRCLEDFFNQPSRRVVGRESADEAHERFSAAVTGLLQNVTVGPAVVVTHGAVISLFVARANQISSYSLWDELEFTSFVALRVPSFSLEAVIHPRKAGHDGEPA